jgi:hypothetical protein
MDRDLLLIWAFILITGAVGSATLTLTLSHFRG